MIEFKSRLNELLRCLKYENDELTEKTGTCYEFGGISNSFLNNTELFKNGVVKFVDLYYDDDLFFMEVHSCLIGNIRSKICGFEYKINEIRDREKQLIIKEKLLYLDFFMPLSLLRKGKEEMVEVLNNSRDNRRSLNTVKSWGEMHEDFLKKVSDELEVVDVMREINEITSFFKDKYLANFTSNIVEVRAIDESLQKEMATYINNYYSYYELINVIALSRSREINIKDYLCDLSSEIIALYKNAGIDLQQTDVQFNKYKLLSLNKYITITNEKYNSYLTDSRLKGFNFNFYPDKKLVDTIIDLLKNKIIVDASFKISSISEVSFGMEELEYGSTLSLNINEMPKMSALYDKNYDDKLLVSHNKDKKELTFEELRSDFITDNDCVVTQIIHLQYYKDREEYFINHLDHEFIIYSMDEYDLKIRDSKVYGTVGKVKIFKIDNSSIPFHYKDIRGFFLFNVLDSTFIHKDLICEYFRGALE